MRDNKSKKYILISITCLFLFIIGISYAYFTARIIGTGKKVTVHSGELNVIFTDTTEILVDNAKLPWSTTKTFTVENESNDVFYYDINIKDLINTLVTDGYLQYKITSDTGYNMTEYLTINKSPEKSTQQLASYVSISGKATQEYTIEFRYIDDEKVDQSGDMGKTFSGKLSIVESDTNTLYGRLLRDNPTRTGQRPNAFDGVYTDDNTGVMYVASGNQTEDGSNVYYFAGNAKNNWVKFGKDENNNDLYWRIIRTNEDRSVRMLYAGTSPSTTRGYIYGNQAYSGTYNDPMYVGYMYGSSGSLSNNRTNENNSDIKTTIDNWYRDGLNTKTDASGNTYDAYISQTAIYCNDRAHEGTYTTSAALYYAAYYRLTASNSDYANTGINAPSYKCGNDASGNLYSTVGNADKFSKNTSKGGNGQLTYPVALITADEISFAGGLFATNAPAWYYYNSENDSITGSAWWWTMSPNDFYDGISYGFYVRGSDSPGALRGTSVRSAAANVTYGARPVLSIKSCITWIAGNGSSESPYQVMVDETCASSVN